MLSNGVVFDTAQNLEMKQADALLNQESPNSFAESVKRSTNLFKIPG